ncbi:LemA family protein [Oceanisphaera pacifica]|uniref:LemA family protein n=1 Tax=Oceanisphaera pacifica TaxID=2818389 RepID=A0ABS3NCJ8_9GAMM|nr:LemA family protein [Oceanisphaera pacifica]MBO1518323.1 LemA family protein [Oceanisphaera pacifica]
MEYIFLAIALVILFWAVTVYNKLVALIEAVLNSEKEISVQLDRRGKVFDSLISTVKRFMEHESEVFTKVTALRAQAIDLNASPEAVKQAEDELSNMVNSGAINIAVESYPELKSDRNMMQLQEEIVSTENKLTFAKKAYNSAIERYQVTKKSFPNIMVVNIFSDLNQEFEYWSLDEAAIKTEEARRVQF